MRVLFATVVSESSNYMSEMIANFRSHGIDLDIFDANEIDSPPYPMRARIGFRVPPLRECMAASLARTKLRGYRADYDAINIHFAAPIFSHIIGSLRRRSRKLVTSIWGSDFLRASPNGLEHLSHILDASDVVTTNNPEIRDKLVRRFPGVADKLRIVRFGLASVDLIPELRNIESEDDMRRRLGVPLAKTVVTLGYNGMKQQQHGMMINAIAALPSALKARLFVFVPMTYPDDKPYQDEIEVMLASVGVEFCVLRGIRDLAEICRVRLVSDYAINVQTTDSLSGSIQEQMLAGTRMIIGDWLPYKVFEEMGVPVQKVCDAASITAALIATNLERKSAQAPFYAEKIRQYSSWKSNIESWIALYRF